VRVVGDVFTDRSQPDEVSAYLLDTGEASAS
jgi:hypothetical protein